MTSKLLVESVGAGALKTRGDGTYPVVLISPGKGSSGYYSESLIEAYAPDAWPKGTHVYLDHLKEGETRTPEKLLGWLVEDTTIDEEGNAVNVFKPISKHAEWIEEVAPIVGLSISARGNGKVGTVNGEQVYIVESLDPHITNTVDVVSYAGRGGKFLEQLLESANSSETPSATVESGITKGNDTMTLEEQIAALLPVVASLVAKIDARESAEAAAAAVVPDVKAEVAKAVEATRKVESAEVTASVKATLSESILAGNYDVDAAIAQDVALREEIRAELAGKAAPLNEALGSSAAGATVNTDDYAVAGWGK